MIREVMDVLDDPRAGGPHSMPCCRRTCARTSAISCACRISSRDKDLASPTWNLTVLTIREARRYVEELMMLNLTVPASRAAGPDANAD